MFKFMKSLTLSLIQIKRF